MDRTTRDHKDRGAGDHMRRPNRRKWRIHAGVCCALLCATLAHARPPNVVLILADDLGFSDIGAHGSEIHTPHIDSLAAEGLRFTSFYNMAKCETTRAALYTGLVAEKRHAANAQTLPELLRGAGYHTAMVGKKHFRDWAADLLLERRPFDDALTFYGLVRYFVPSDGTWDGRWETPFLLNGEELLPSQMDLEREPFYQTDAFTDYALRFLDRAHATGKPFFLYLPYHAPHYPLQAREEDIARYRDTYRAGWDAIRAERFRRQRERGTVPANARLSSPEGNVNRFRPPYRGEIYHYRPWAEIEAAEQDALALEMAVFAAMVDRLDRNIGRVLARLKTLGVQDDTLVLFLADNGSCPYDSNEDFAIPPGGPDSFRTLSAAWAHVGNTPFRYFKQYGHEGGTRTPFIARWPGRIEPGATDALGHVADVFPTLLDIADAAYPATAQGGPTPALDGASLLPVLDGGSRPEPELLISGFTERFRMVRMGEWKIVRVNGEPWQLYHLPTDPTELVDRASGEPARLESLVARYHAWIQEHDAVMPHFDEVAAGTTAPPAADVSLEASAPPVP